MDTGKLHKKAAELNSFIVLADVYCRYYSVYEPMFEFMAVMAYIKKLYEDLYYEIIKDENCDI